MSTATESALESATAVSNTVPRFVAVRANLMPHEVISARSADRMRQRVIVGLAGLVVVLVAVYLASWFQTHSAKDKLASLQTQGATLQNQTIAFGPLVTAQSQTASIQSQLQQLMVGDLSWHDMLTTLRAKAPNGVTLNQIGGTITSGAAGANGAAGTTGGGYGALNQSGQLQVGTLTLTGTARSKTDVANYVDSLGKVKGLASPFPNSVTSSAGAVTFNLTVLITAVALGGRYSSPSVTPTATTPTATTGGN
jgi:Tfp pilus assembly protein PilN